MTSRVIFILKQASSTTGRCRTLSQKMAMKMVIVVHGEGTYCYPSTFSGKQNENCRTSQRQIRSENTPGRSKQTSFFFTLQQLANNKNSAIFHSNVNRITKLPKSITTTTQTFDGKSEKFQLFEDFFQTSSKFTISWLKMTESTTSTLLWGEMRYRHLKTLMTQPKIVWEKFSLFFPKEVRKTPVDGDSET